MDGYNSLRIQSQRNGTYVLLLRTFCRNNVIVSFTVASFVKPHFPTNSQYQGFEDLCFFQPILMHLHAQLHNLHFTFGEDYQAGIPHYHALQFKSQPMETSDGNEEYVLAYSRKPCGDGFHDVVVNTSFSMNLSFPGSSLLVPRSYVERQQTIAKLGIGTFLTPKPCIPIKPFGPRHCTVLGAGGAGKTILIHHLRGMAPVMVIAFAGKPYRLPTIGHTVPQETILGNPRSLPFIRQVQLASQHKPSGLDRHVMHKLQGLSQKAIRRWAHRYIHRRLCEDRGTTSCSISVNKANSHELAAEMGDFRHRNDHWTYRITGFANCDFVLRQERIHLQLTPLATDVMDYIMPYVPGDFAVW